MCEIGGNEAAVARSSDDFARAAAVNGRDRQHDVEDRRLVHEDEPFRRGPHPSRRLEPGSARAPARRFPTHTSRRTAATFRGRGRVAESEAASAARRSARGLRPRGGSGTPDGGVLTSRRHCVIFNPEAGRGRGRRRARLYRSLLERYLPDVTFRATGAPGEEADLAMAAADDGFDVVVAVGGDGTWSNVADRLVAHERDDVALAILPSGTGNDFGRNFGFLRRRPADAVRAIVEGHARLVDVGHVKSPSAPEHHPGRFEKRYFLNVVGFGFDAAVIEATAGARLLSGGLLYRATALRLLLRFNSFAVVLTSSAGATREARLLMLTISNAPYFGGGFPIAPDAGIDDGLLHACQIHDAAPLSRLRLFSQAEKGRHVLSDRVEILDDEGFRLRFDEPPRFQLDGELRAAQSDTVEIRVVPSALRVIAPPT